LKAESGNEEKEEEELKLEKNMREGRLPLEFRDRAKSFAAMAIRLYVKLPKDREEVRVCGKQLLRAGTSVAAHVREASRARSDAEFISKLGGALQETDETQLWLELLSEECRIQSSLTNPMRQEADELIAIMTTMVRRTEEKQMGEKQKVESRKLK
jgi:four helix bundle protein